MIEQLPFTTWLIVRLVFGKEEDKKSKFFLNDEEDGNGVVYLVQKEAETRGDKRVEGKEKE